MPDMNKWMRWVGKCSMFSFTVRIISTAMSLHFHACCPTHRSLMLFSLGMKLWLLPPC